MSMRIMDVREIDMDREHSPFLTWHPLAEALSLLADDGFANVRAPPASSSIPPQIGARATSCSATCLGESPAIVGAPPLRKAETVVPPG
jgi:hypothetical protein